MKRPGKRPAKRYADADLDDRARWLRNFDRRAASFAESAHPRVARRILIGELERRAEGSWAPNGKPTREAVLALTLEVQRSLLAEDGLNDALLIKALRAVRRAMNGTNQDRDEVLRILSDAVTQDPEDRIPFVKTRLRRFFGVEPAVSDTTIQRVLTGWEEVPRGVAAPPKWKVVQRFIAELGLGVVDPDSIARVWRKLQNAKRVPER